MTVGRLLSGKLNAEFPVVKPGNGLGRFGVSCCQQERIARPARQCDNDVVDLDMGAGAYRLAEEGPGLDALQAVAYPFGKDALERTGHER